MRENLVHIYLYVLVEACIVPCYVDCKAYPFLQKTRLVLSNPADNFRYTFGISSEYIWGKENLSIIPLICGPCFPRTVWNDGSVTDLKRRSLLSNFAMFHFQKDFPFSVREVTGFTQIVSQTGYLVLHLPYVQYLLNYTGISGHDYTIKGSIDLVLSSIWFLKLSLMSRAPETHTWDAHRPLPFRRSLFTLIRRHSSLVSISS